MWGGITKVKSETFESDDCPLFDCGDRLMDVHLRVFQSSVRAHFKRAQLNGYQLCLSEAVITAFRISDNCKSRNILNWLRV